MSAKLVKKQDCLLKIGAANLLFAALFIWAVQDYSWRRDSMGSI